MESRTTLNDSTVNSKYDYILNSTEVLLIPLTRCDHLINRPSNIIVKQEFIQIPDNDNDNQLSQIRTECETREIVNINGTEIKIERDYIDGCTFESMISRENSNKSLSKFLCKFCRQTFTDKFRIRRHKRICSKKPTFTCDICKKSFHKKLLLISHILNHRKDKSKKCDVCNKMFSTNGYLKVHMRIHTGESTFTCDICNQSFRQKVHLKRHIIYHTGKNSYK